MRDRLPTTAPPPAWLTEDEFASHVAALDRGGLTGPLNRYRNVDRDWEDLGVVLRQPSIYLAGTRDSSTVWLADAVARQTQWLPGIDGVHLLDGAGHWLNRERPDDVNALLIEWLRRHRPPR